MSGRARWLRGLAVTAGCVAGLAAAAPLVAATHTVSSGPLRVDLRTEFPPEVTTYPANQMAAPGGNATFAVAFAGLPAPSLQWQVSTDGGNAWTNLVNDGVHTGVTTATLTVTGATTAMHGHSYRAVATNAGGTAGSGAVFLSVPTSGYLANLSVRAAMAAGQTLIAGFVVEGGTKPMLVRAAGPVLGNYGLNGVADPRLALHAGDALVAQNDDWPSSLAAHFAAVGAFPFEAASLDSALRQAVSGPHTAQASATGAGAILVEAYDAGANDAGKLTNLSARFRVGTGDDLLIAGFVLAGTGTRQVLVRAVGPKLADYGVTGVLADPRLSVFDGGTELAGNDDWSASLASAFTALGAFALDAGSKDAAMLVTLSAGKTYTVQVSGSGGTTGEALVEIYLVP